MLVAISKDVRVTTAPFVQLIDSQSVGFAPQFVLVEKEIV